MTSQSSFQVYLNTREVFQLLEKCIREQYPHLTNDSYDLIGVAINENSLDSFDGEKRAAQLIFSKVEGKS